MDKRIKELMRLRGVGKILAVRFLDAGIDSYEKVAAAGEEGLKKIKGINPLAVSGILTQASELASATVAKPEQKMAELKEKSLVLTGKVQEIASDVRQRFKEEISGRIGKKIEKQIIRIIISAADFKHNPMAGFKEVGNWRKPNGQRIYLTRDHRFGTIMSMHRMPGFRLFQIQLTMGSL